MKCSVPFRRGSTTAALLLAALSSVVHATATAATLHACDDIATALPGRVSYPGSLAYLTEVNSYWSGALKMIKPACLVLPTSAQEVASIVQVLNGFPDVDFAVK